MTSECRKVATEKCQDMVPNSGIQETDINTVWSDETKGRTTKYMGDGVVVLRDQLTVLGRSEDFLFHPIERSNRKDGTLVQMEPMQSQHFHNIYRAVCKLVFSNKDDKFVWKRKDSDLPRSFVVLLQFFYDKTYSTWSSSFFCVSYTFRFL